MILLEKDSAHQADHAPRIIPDTNDPTAGQVAISRELASEQVRIMADRRCSALAPLRSQPSDRRDSHPTPTHVFEHESRTQA